MKLAGIAALTLFTFALVAGRAAGAELDPACANVDLNSHTVRAFTNEMQGYVETGDIGSAKYVYQSGVRMAVGSYDIAPQCGSDYDLSAMDDAFEQLVQQAYYDRVITAYEAQFWMKMLLAGAPRHSDSRDQINAWSAFAQELAVETGHHFRTPPPHSPG
jgi:hypothetical protein